MLDKMTLRNTSKFVISFGIIKTMSPVFPHYHATYSPMDALVRLGHYFVGNLIRHKPLISEVCQDSQSSST